MWAGRRAARALAPVRPFTSTSQPDVVIVGGGAIGAATAYFLKARAPQISVLCLEKDLSYANASFTRSNSAIRQQYSTPASVAMMQFSAQFLRDAPDLLDTALNERPDVGFQERGYLFLAGRDEVPLMRELHQIHRELGAPTALLSPDEVRERFPYVNAEGVELASLGLAGEGWFNPTALVHGFRAKAQALGAEFKEATVTGLDVADGRVTHVHTDLGTVGCGSVVNAAGSWAGPIAAMAGIDLPVEAKKRCLYLLDVRRSDPEHGAAAKAFAESGPFLVDSTGVFARPDSSGGFVVGFSRLEAIDWPDPTMQGSPCEIEDADWELFEEYVWPTIAERVPCLEAAKCLRGWAGFYEVSFDHNCILGYAPAVSNLVLANGFSGHGMMQAPPAARAVSELLVDGGFHSLDLSCFGYDRVTRNEPYTELCVV